MKKEQKQSNKVDYKQTLIDAINSEDGTICEMFRLNYNFSPLNCILATIQLKKRGLPMGALKTFKAWNKENRSIKKGEKALWLRRPVTFQEKDEHGKKLFDKEGKPKMVTYFPLVPQWFAYSQTTGEEYDYKKLNDKIFDFDTAMENLNIKKVDFDTANANSGGYSIPSERILAVNPQWHDDFEVASCLFHEIAHIQLEHHKAKYDKRTIEVEAEAVSLLIFKILDLDILKTQKGYMRSWAHGNAEIITNELAKRVVDAVGDILKAGKVKVEI